MYYYVIQCYLQNPNTNNIGLLYSLVSYVLFRLFFKNIISRTRKHGLKPICPSRMLRGITNFTNTNYTRYAIAQPQHSLKWTLELWELVTIVTIRNLTTLGIRTKVCCKIATRSLMMHSQRRTLASLYHFNIFSHYCAHVPGKEDGSVLFASYRV